MDLSLLQNRIYAIAYGSVAHGLAVELCRVQGLPPDVLSPIGMLNWQAQVYQALLREGLAIAARNGQ